MAERSVLNSVPKLPLTKGGLWRQMPSMLHSSSSTAFTASPLPEVHCSYFSCQTWKISVAKKPKFMLQLGLWKMTGPARAVVGQREFSHPKIPIFLCLYSCRIPSSVPLEKEHQNKHLVITDHQRQRWSMSDSYLSKWMFWGNFNHFPFLEKRQTGYILKSLPRNGPQFWDVVIDSDPRTFSPSHITVVHVPCQLLPNWSTSGPRPYGTRKMCYHLDGRRMIDKSLALDPCYMCYEVKALNLASL